MKLTLENLIENKEKISPENLKTQEIDMKRLGGTVTLQQPDESTVRDAADMEDDSYLVYMTIIEPNLRDKKLQEAYKCAKPSDIVSKIFNLGEIAELSKEALKLVGINDGSVVAVKN